MGRRGWQQLWCTCWGDCMLKSSNVSFRLLAWRLALSETGNLAGPGVQLRAWLRGRIVRLWVVQLHPIACFASRMCTSALGGFPVWCCTVRRAHAQYALVRVLVTCTVQAAACHLDAIRGPRCAQVEVPGGTICQLVRYGSCSRQFQIGWHASGHMRCTVHTNKPRSVAHGVQVHAFPAAT